MYGADILRLWVAFGDYTDNLKISDDIIKQIIVDYRKIRNSIKFLLANVSDFELDYQPSSFSLFNEIVLGNISQTFDNIKSYFE